MAKYNLMNNQRPDYFDRYFDEDDDTKEPSTIEEDIPEKLPDNEAEAREYFEESLFTEDTENESVSGLSTDIDNIIEKKLEMKERDQNIGKSEEKSPEESAIKKETPEPVIEEKTPDEDYEDTKMQKINRKPLLIVGAIFIILGMIVFVLFKWVFVQGEEVIVEKKPAITPQEQMRIEQEKTKIAFIKNINAEKNSRLGYFSNLSDLQIKNVSYSSVLLYANSFSFEIFGSSRDDIARFNLNLKKNKYSDKYKIVSVTARPGSKGGVFALYNVKKGSKSGAISAKGDPQIESNIQARIKKLAQKNELTVKSDRAVSRKKVDQFELLRMEYTYRGSETNCLNFLKDLSNENSNFSVHKISLIPTNQRDFRKSKYQLLLVLDFYV